VPDRSGATGAVAIQALACIAVLLLACAFDPDIGAVPEPPDECTRGTARCLDGGQREVCDWGLLHDAWFIRDCPVDNPHCVVTSTDPERAECADTPNCAGTLICADEGLCGDGPTGCIATAEGCQRGEVCRWEGLCGMSDGACVATEGGCASSSLCQHSGQCGVGDAGECVPTAIGCAESDLACPAFGLCAAGPTYCRATPEGCAESIWSCEVDGWCGFDPSTERCVATAEGCEQSSRCESLGYCRVEGTDCVQ
jgi:hypothetical protein